VKLAFVIGLVLGGPIWIICLNLYELHKDRKYRKGKA
jgi:hypothetical protein